MFNFTLGTNMHPLRRDKLPRCTSDGTVPILYLIISKIVNKTVNLTFLKLKVNKSEKRQNM